MEEFKFKKAENRENKSEVRVEIPTKEDELRRIGTTLQNIKWFEENYYYPNQIVLPKYHKELAEKILSGEISMTEVDSNELEQALEYSRNDYVEADKSVNNEILRRGQEVIAAFEQWHTRWGFKIFEKYSILLTKYGTEGSYNYDKGLAILRIDTPNHFSMAMHEFVHIGIEEIIIKKYGLSHWKKERIVDLICNNILKLSGCAIKEGGEEGLSKLNKFVTSETINNLPNAIEKYLQNKS